MLTASSVNHVYSRKRGALELAENTLYNEDQDQKKHKLDYAQHNSLYSTCGELVHSQEDYWGKENVEMGDGAAMESEADVLSVNQKALEVPDATKMTPVGHKGRSISDYCTVISAKKFKGSDLSKSVHFEENSMVVDPLDETTQMDAYEPVRMDSHCQGCKAPVNDATYLVQCNFCSRSFCSAGCVCSCEHCGGVFCHSTCSTLNYSFVFVKTLCLDCNSDCGTKGYYYST